MYCIFAFHCSGHIFYWFWSNWFPPSVLLDFKRIYLLEFLDYFLQTLKWHRTTVILSMHFNGRNIFKAGSAQMPFLWNSFTSRARSFIERLMARCSDAMWGELHIPRVFIINAMRRAHEYFSICEVCLSQCHGTFYYHYFIIILLLFLLSLWNFLFLILYSFPFL